MSKFCGMIGFSLVSEDEPGINEDHVFERKYYGDILRGNWRTNGGDNIVDDIGLSNQISILADLYARENIGIMRYVIVNGIRWKIMSVDIQYPRLVLEVGGIYNGPTP